MRSIDLNCDLGEGAGHDEELMPLITSANIACGGHAGDHATMVEAVKSARFYGVATGAHPGYGDRENFGRRNLSLKAKEIFQLVRDQVVTMQAVTKSLDVAMTHVKPHGALYTQAARDRGIADAIAEAVGSVDEGLRLYGLSGSALIDAAQQRGLPVANEVFVDRTYQGDGTLTPRDHPEALIKDIAAGVSQAMSMLCDGVVPTIDGAFVPVVADTICVHGDGEHAVDYVRELRAALTRAGVELSSAAND